MKDFELLGQFYLGRLSNPKGAPSDELLLYDSKDLTTHAVIVGMTGSGKTGLGIAMLEEAAIDGVPSIVIDPKGDMGNLMLKFPDLRPEDFKPWIDPTEAAQKALSIDAAAAEAAKSWKEGLAQWGEDGQRIARYAAAAETTIYTPGSNAGVPVSVLRSFSAPSQAILDDPDAFRERVSSAASGVLALLQIEADPMRSREHMLISNIFDRAWREGKSLDLAGLIQSVQSPPFERIGVLDLESAFPAKERFALAMSLNGILAAPNFSAWIEGEPLDVQRLLWTAEGKPRVSILSIAHLGDAERMFFVTTLLNEVIAWMRAQPGTASLRAMLYMDEVFGFFPPTANPPSKTPMLTLLKQARAFGLGIVLATQNPVDLDYKGLGNAGTWFLGRLQTERDKLRVLDGLEGVSAQASKGFDRAAIDKLLSASKKRVFLMSNAHESAPVLFETRWALSYLRGPLTRAQIQGLSAARKAAGKATSPSQAASPAAATVAAPSRAEPAARASSDTKIKPILPPDVAETFIPATRAAPGEAVEYRPCIFGSAKVHYVDKKAGVDHWETVSVLGSVPDELALEPWANSSTTVGAVPAIDKQPGPAASFGALPSIATRAKAYEKWGRALKDHLLSTRAVSIFTAPGLETASRPGESEGDFRSRLSLATRERRDAEIEEIRRKHASQVATLEDRIRTAEGRVAHEQGQVSASRWQTATSFGSAVLGVLFGRRAGFGSAGGAVKAFSKTGREKEDVARAEESVTVLRQRLADLTSEIESDVAQVRARGDPSRLEVQVSKIAPKKTDITVGAVVLAWTPWRIQPDGRAAPAFQL